MKITSDAFLEGELIPTKYTCDGENINPPLRFSDVPDEAVTLALIMDDPDAPNKTWVHWVLWNIASGQKGIGEGEIFSESIEGVTSFGQRGFGGPCPHSGTHRYFFKLYALDTKLLLPKESTKKDLEEAMAGHVIKQAELMGTYARR
ncbi:MAG: YbhB/YbcL family Raf kinase inhibitor-like protein [Patescibacteria group bacterium]|nr:YbhB/YbcL family Raf kinase inhibitor-like protein [Patescibacteria group bacterium]